MTKVLYMILFTGLTMIVLSCVSFYFVYKSYDYPRIIEPVESVRDVKVDSSTKPKKLSRARKEILYAHRTFGK